MAGADRGANDSGGDSDVGGANITGVANDAGSANDVRGADSAGGADDSSDGTMVASLILAMMILKFADKERAFAESNFHEKTPKTVALFATAICLLLISFIVSLDCS